MKTQIALVADAQSLPPKAIRGEDNVIYVEVGYRTEEDTGVLVALAPFVIEVAPADHTTLVHGN
jgi:hypothetical protein